MKRNKKTYQSGGATQRGQAIGGGVGTGAGAAIGTFLLPGVGTKLGATIGGGIGSTIGGLIGRGREKEPEPPATVGQVFQSSYGFQKGGSIKNTRNQILDGVLSLPGVGSLRLAEGGGIPHMQVGGRHHEAGGVSLEAFGRPEVEVERDEITTFDAIGEPDYVFSNLRMQDKPRTYAQEFQRLSEKGDLSGIRNLKRKQEEAMGRKINVTMDSSLRKAQMAKYGGSLKSTGGSLQSEEGFSASRAAARYGGKLQKRSGGALSPFKQEGGSLNRLWGDIRRTFGGPENRPISERPRFQAAQQRAGQAPSVVGQRTIYTPPQGAAGAAPGYSPPGVQSMVHTPQAQPGAASRFGSFLRNPATWKSPGTWNAVGIGAMAGYHGANAIMGETPFEAKDRRDEARGARDRAMFNRQQQEFRRGLEEPEGILFGSPFYNFPGAQPEESAVNAPAAPVASPAQNAPAPPAPARPRTPAVAPNADIADTAGFGPERPDYNPQMDYGEDLAGQIAGPINEANTPGRDWASTAAGLLPYAADLFNMRLAARAKPPERVRAPMPARMDTRVPTAAAEEAATRGARGITGDPSATMSQRLAATAGLHQARGQIRGESDMMSRGIEAQNLRSLNRARELGYHGEMRHQEALQQHEGAKLSVYSQGVRSISDRLERRAFEKRAQELLPFQVTALVHSLPTEQRRALIDDLLGSLPPGHPNRAQLEALSKRGAP